METNINMTTNSVMGGVKIRRSNLELYRIIVMLLIVAHHYVVNSGLTDVMAKEPLSIKSLYLYMLGMWGKTGINCFILITGYFMCRSNITLRKFLKLFLEVMFYKFVIWAIFVGVGYEPFSIKLMLKELSPIVSIADGFVSCFIIFYLFIPFLNILVNNMDKRMHTSLLVLCLFTYTVLGTLPKLHVEFNYITWFSILYFISSYIRIYALFPRIKNYQWGFLTLFAMGLSLASILSLIALHIHFGLPLAPYRLLSDSNALMAVVLSICTFMYFKDLPIKQSKVINIISASTFGVLLIHANSDTMRQWLWKDTLNVLEQYASDYLIWLSIGSVLSVFTICIILDYVRIHTFEKWIFRILDKRIGNR